MKPSLSFWKYRIGSYLGASYEPHIARRGRERSWEMNVKSYGNGPGGWVKFTMLMLVLIPPNLNSLVSYASMSFASTTSGYT